RPCSEVHHRCAAPTTGPDRPQKIPADPGLTNRFAGDAEALTQLRFGSSEPHYRASDWYGPRPRDGTPTTHGHADVLGRVRPLGRNPPGRSRSRPPRAHGAG